IAGEATDTAARPAPRRPRPDRVPATRGPTPPVAARVLRAAPGAFSGRERLPRNHPRPQNPRRARWSPGDRLSPGGDPWTPMVLPDASGCPATTRVHGTGWAGRAGRPGPAGLAARLGGAGSGVRENGCVADIERRTRLTSDEVALVLRRA